MARLSPVSRTAIYVAAGRAIGAREPDCTARNPDYLAEKLLGDPSKLDLDHPAVRALGLRYDEAMQDVEVVGNVRMMTVRTRFIDEKLERAIADGASQVVILGAGFDSHAYRYIDLLKGARVFEVDRPAMQALKKERVEEVLGGPPPNLAYVAVDFQHDDLPKTMARYGYDPSRQTFFILEGVTMYLPEDDLRATLRFIAAHPPGSGVVFDFVSRTLVDMLARLDVATVPDLMKPFVERFLNLIEDEPWLFGFPLGGEEQYLGELGLELREVLTIGGEESVKRYLTRSDGTQIGAEALAAAAARFAESARAAGHSVSPEQAQQTQRLLAHQVAEAIVAEG